MLIVQAGLPHHLWMHLPQDDGTALARHVTRSDAVFDPVGCVTVFLHLADTASGEGDIEGAITEAVILAAEAKARVREKPEGVDGLFKASSVVIVLRQPFRPIMVHVHGYGVDKALADHFGSDEG